jgi:hypothetical protein
VSKDSHQLDGGRCLPTSRSYAAGFRSSSELSSLSGVRHFWQYMAGNTHSQREESLVVDDVVLMSLSFESYRCWVHFNASYRAGACRSQRHWRAPAAEQSPGHSEADPCPPRRIVMCPPGPSFAATRQETTRDIKPRQPTTDLPTSSINDDIFANPFRLPSLSRFVPQLPRFRIASQRQRHRSRGHLPY